MDKKTALAAMAFCLATGHAFGAQEVDLKTLKLLQEEGVSVDEFEKAFLGKHGTNEKPAVGNYSTFSLSDSNYSTFSVSSGNYSTFSLSDSNYSTFSVSAGSYSTFSLSGGDEVTVNGEGTALPTPQVAVKKGGN